MQYVPFAADLDANVEIAVQYERHNPMVSASSAYAARQSDQTTGNDSANHVNSNINTPAPYGATASPKSAPSPAH